MTIATGETIEATCETVSETIKTIRVDVRASENEDGTVKFDSYWRHAGGKPGVWKSGIIDLPHGPEHYKLTFDLDDKSGRNLKFYGTDPTHKEPDQAMYCQVDPAPCPPPKGNGAGQIEYLDVDVDQLTIKDFNRDPPCTLKYVLRFDGDPFVGPDGKQYPPYEYDPELRNGGGG